MFLVTGEDGVNYHLIIGSFNCNINYILEITKGGFFMSEHKEEKLKRSLQARHLNMIAIGGAIGTGLFVASGASISMAGPGGALVAYACIGVMVYFLMTSLGEMATLMPVSGSFETYATRFVDPALGFALGWNYWYNWAITVACELVAGALVMKFWLPDVSGLVWSMIFLVILFALNLVSARMYGEAEFWFAGIKVVTIVIFLVVGVLMIIGVMGGHSPGFSNWTIKDAPFSGGFAAVFSIAMVAGFSFQGTELVGIAAGESENPEKNVPKAINSVFWRILIFYIGALTVIGFVLPYTDPNLLKAGTDNIAMSPFTLIFERAGLGGSGGCYERGNPYFRTFLRKLRHVCFDPYALCYGRRRQSAEISLAKVNKRGVPINCLYFNDSDFPCCFPRLSGRRKHDLSLARQRFRYGRLHRMARNRSQSLSLQARPISCRAKILQP